jgi:tetratricopeptide (TPR) repeat protein
MAQKAFEYIEQQYQKRHQIADLRQINVMLTCYCVITCSLRKFDRTIEALKEGIQLQKQLGDAHRQYHLLTLLGYVYLWNDDAQRAIACCKNNIDQSRRYGYKGYQTMGLAQLSYMYCGLGNLRLARAFAKRSRAMTRHFDNCLPKGASLAALGVVYLHQGRLFRCLLLIIRSLMTVAPITSGDSKIILMLLVKHLGDFRRRLHKRF